MNKLGINLGLAAASTLSLLTFAPTAEAAGLNLGSNLSRNEKATGQWYR